ncbi:MAG: hypothetical protein ACLFO1_10360, partial [Spirochaetaceae bacterium]
MRHSRPRSAPLALSALLLMLFALAVTACAGNESRDHVKAVVDGFFEAVEEQDLAAAEQYFLDLPEGSLALVSPETPPRGVVSDYKIRDITIRDGAAATAEVAVPGQTGTTVLTFSLKKHDGRWYLQEDISARVELGDVQG